MNYFPKVGTKIRIDKQEIVVAKLDIFRELVYIRYPTDEWKALKLTDFNSKFDLTAHN